MAALSEADKRAILGDNYQEVLAKAQQEGHAKTSSEQLKATQIEKCESRQFSAFAVMVVGAILIVSNYYAVSGPSVVLVGRSARSGFCAGAGWYVHLWRTLRRLRTDAPGRLTQIAFDAPFLPPEGENGATFRASSTSRLRKASRKLPTRSPKNTRSRLST